MAMEATLQVRLEEFSQEEIDAHLEKSFSDAASGRGITQDELDARMKTKFSNE